MVLRIGCDGKITQIIVSEHQYAPWTEGKRLFKSTAQEGDIIAVDEPIHSLAADGFTVLDSGANWTKVSAGSGVLSGKTYLRNTCQSGNFSGIRHKVAAME